MPDEIKDNFIPPEPDGTGDLGGFADTNTPPAGTSVNAISERLNSKASSGEVTESGMKPMQSVPFDINSLTTEQIQLIKERFAATPEKMHKKLDRPVIELKHVNGKIIMDFKQSFLALVEDEVKQKKVEAHMLAVLLEGEKEYVNMRLSEFRKLPVVEAEIISTSTEDDSYVEGEVFSAERKTMVEMLVKRFKYAFTVKVKGRSDTLVIEGKLANA